MGEANRRKKTESTYGSERKETTTRGWHRLRRSSTGRKREAAYYWGALSPKGESRQTVRREGRELEAKLESKGRKKATLERLEARRKFQNDLYAELGLAAYDKKRKPWVKGFSAAKFAAPRLLSKNGRWRLERRESRA